MVSGQLLRADRRGRVRRSRHGRCGPRTLPPPLPPDDGGDCVYGMDDGDLIYGDEDEDPLIYGAAEAFDTSAVDAMMDEIYGTM